MGLRGTGLQGSGEDYITRNLGYDAVSIRFRGAHGCRPQGLAVFASQRCENPNTRNYCSHLQSKGKGKIAIVCLRHESVWRSGGLSPIVLNIGTRWCGQLNFWPFYLRYPLHGRLGWPEPDLGVFVEEKNLSPLLEI